MVTEVEQQKTISNEHKAEHLQMIQSVIERMSTTSALYKGFSATIVTGVSAISFVDINSWILLLAFVPVICFCVMDVYYFRLEKKYRILYEKVRLGKAPADFSMNANCENSELLDANGSLIQCLKSPCILWFYIPIIAIGMIIIGLKFIGII